MKAGEIAVNVIARALELIPDESKWAGSADALNESGGVCPSSTEAAVKFGGYGSLMGAAHRLHKETRFADAAYSSTLDFIEHRVGKVNLNYLNYAATVTLFKKVLGY